MDLSAAARSQLSEEAVLRPGLDGVEDMRDLPWSSIDDATTRDVDQIECSERLPGGGVRVRVGIADVDAFVPQATPLDRHAGVNTVTVYAGDPVLPMLPPELSTGRTSLLAGEERLALVVEFDVGGDGGCAVSRVARARVRNRAQLAYPDVSAFLEGRGPEPKASREAALGDQVRMQDEAARALRQRREERGALEFETVEARPIVRGGRVVDIRLTRKGLGRDLIEDLMIAANASIADSLEDAGFAWIRRQVRAPERWPRIVALAAAHGAKLPAEPDRKALAEFLVEQRKAAPEDYAELSLSVVKLLGSGEYVVEHRGEELQGHFALAVPDYTHFTAPNRRYTDVVTQRLVKAALLGRESPYPDDALEQVAAHCTEMEDRARHVERKLRKVAAAELVADRVGQDFHAVVTGVTRGGTWARLTDPPVEGRIVQGADGLDVGEKTRVRLVAVDPARGHIDFAAG